MIRLYRWWRNEVEWDIKNGYRWHAVLWYLLGLVVAIITLAMALLALFIAVSAPVFTFWLIVVLAIAFTPFWFIWRKARRR